MNAANLDAIRTTDRDTALSFLAHLLDSPEPVNAEIQNLGGSYSVEVSRPTDDCGDDAARWLRSHARGPLRAQVSDGSEHVGGSELETLPRPARAGAQDERPPVNAAR